MTFLESRLLEERKSTSVNKSVEKSVVVWLNFACLHSDGCEKFSFSHSIMLDKTDEIVLFLAADNLLVLCFYCRIVFMATYSNFMVTLNVGILSA